MTEKSALFEAKEDDEWVFDSLIGFLSGPVWNLSITAFVENKSVVFDPETEHVTEYKLIYEEYKALVDRLLTSLMADLSISEQQFDDVIKHLTDDRLRSSRLRLETLFTQIWAANDFAVFVPFMTQRNVELQLQALEILAQRYGLVYESFIRDGNEGEEDINEAVKQEMSVEVKADQGEDRDEELKLIEKKVFENERKRLERICLNTKVGEKSEPKDKSEATVEAVVTPVVSEKGAEKGAKSDPKSCEREMLERTEYLRNQRDKLLAIKRREREKQLLKVERQQLIDKRPKSAKAVRSVVSVADQSSEPDIDQSLAFRRSLAARLKAEVVEKEKK